MLTTKKGNIFTTQCQTIVNTINCVGVMGAGIAFEFKLRTPEMFETYKKHCKNKSISIGKLWLYKLSDNTKTTGYSQILNFPTKHHWKYPSKLDYLEQGLENFVNTYQKRGITSIAFPLLGADKGGIPAEQSQQLMQHYLQKCQIPVEIWQFDPTAQDDLYEQFKQLLLNMSDEQLKTEAKLRIDAINKIKLGLQQPNINSLSGLLRCKGIGEVTLRKSFQLLARQKQTPQKQLKLI